MELRPTEREQDEGQEGTSGERMNPSEQDGSSWGEMVVGKIWGTQQYKL